MGSESRGKEQGALRPLGATGRLRAGPPPSTGGALPPSRAGGPVTGDLGVLLLPLLAASPRSNAIM